MSRRERRGLWRAGRPWPGLVWRPRTVSLAGRMVRLPRHSVRLRLTAIYGGLFLLSGAVLLTITYVVVESQSAHVVTISGGRAPRVGGPLALSPAGLSAPSSQVCMQSATGPTPVPQQLGQCVAYFKMQEAAQRVGYLNTLLIASGIALAVMAAVAICVGWVVAGRVLRPVRTITRAARTISASSLHQRLALAGPDDELKELGDTVDGLLARLEAAFGAQRQFVANASHELRTPLARQRTLVEVALAAPEPTVAGLTAACQRVLAAGEQQERLIEALLTLASSQRGLDQWEHVELASVTTEVLLARHSEARSRQLSVSFADGTRDDGPVSVREAFAAGDASPLMLAGGPAPLLGDAPLAERLVANLVDNALRHNEPGGWISVRVGTSVGQAVLEVANSGPVVPPGEVVRLLAPFQRLGAERRSGPQDGHGLGLSIVSAIATAHGADVRACARPGGGLVVRVRFPPLPAGLRTPGDGAQVAPAPAPALAPGRPLAAAGASHNLPVSSSPSMPAVRAG